MMRGKWSRVLPLLCFAYLCLLIVFHRHLGPSINPAPNDYFNEDVNPLVFVPDNVTHVKHQGPEHLNLQVQKLEKGMTFLEKEIANVKSKLSQDILVRAKHREQLLEKQRVLAQQQVQHNSREIAVKPLLQPRWPQRGKHAQHQGLIQQQQHVQHHQQQQPPPPRKGQRWSPAGVTMAPVQQQQQQHQQQQQQQHAQPLRQHPHDRFFRQPFNMAPDSLQWHRQAVVNNADTGQQRMRGLSHQQDSSLTDIDYSNTSLVKIAKGLAVYSAYHDDRLVDKPFVRLIVVTNAPEYLRGVVCHFHSGTSANTPTATVDAQQYELCENHRKKYLGFIYSCPVPAELARSPYTLSVAPSHSPWQRVALPLLHVTPRDVREGKTAEDSYQYKYNFSICVSPLFGSVLARRLVEFLELTRLLGVQQVFFYDFQLSLTTYRVLQFYQSKGWVTVLPWTLPTTVTDKMIWYHGQLISNNDCLYRTMPLSAYTAFHDIDELIVPRGPTVRTLADLIPPVLPNDTCGYSFMSAFFDPDKASGFASDLMTLAHIDRTVLFSKVRTKVLVSPRRVFEVGIHHISKQFQEHWQPRSFNSSRALLHHYRYCIHDYGMRCDNWVKDSVIADKYLPQLKDNFMAAVRTLRL